MPIQRRNYAYRNPDSAPPGSNPAIPSEDWQSVSPEDRADEDTADSMAEPVKEEAHPPPSPTVPPATPSQLPFYETSHRPRRRRRINSVQHYYHRAMEKLVYKAERAIALWRVAERIYRKQRINRREAARVGQLLAEVARIFTQEMTQLNGAVAAFSGLARDWEAMEAGQTVGYWISGRGVRTVKPYGRRRGG